MRPLRPQASMEKNKKIMTLRLIHNTSSEIRRFQKLNREYVTQLKIKVMNTNLLSS